MRYVLLIVLCLAACAPRSVEEFRKEGDALCKQMVRQLQGIHTREELVAALPILKSYFLELTELMIAARLYQQGSEELLEAEDEALTSSEELLRELKRIYTIEAGRELIEQAQQEALHKLDVFEHKLQEKRA